MMKRGASAIAAFFPLIALVFVFPSMTRAATPNAKPRAHEAAASPAKLTLTIDGSADGVSFHVTNAGDVPVMIAANPRLLSLEITPPTAAEDTAKKKSARATHAMRCALPDDAKPSNEDGIDLVLPPGRTYSHAIDLGFLCFGDHESHALVAGASVVAHYGWSSRSHARPFAVWQIEGISPRIAPAKEIIAAPWTLPAEAVPASINAPSLAAAPIAPSDSEPIPFTITAGSRADVSRGEDLEVNVTLSNKSDRPHMVLYRPTTVRFEVDGPKGHARCSIGEKPAAIRELYTNVAAHGSTTLGEHIDAVCPAGTFEHSGLYVVTAFLDTRGASSEELGFASFEGKVTASTPLTIRVRNPRQNMTILRPRLDDAP